MWGGGRPLFRSLTASFGRDGRNHLQKKQFRSSSSGSQQSAAQKNPLRTHPLLTAAVTSCTLSVAGDIVAQTYEKVKIYDPIRMARLGGFGLFFYGPVQHYWYGFLNAALPVNKALPMSQYLLPFAGKVAANQLLLGPVVVSAVFAWNLALTGKLSDLGDKIQRDALRTLRKGWAFWIPASTLNFAVVPLQYQVLYMSTCGIVWTTILSAASAAQPPAPTAGGKTKKK